MNQLCKRVNKCIKQHCTYWMKLNKWSDDNKINHFRNWVPMIIQDLYCEDIEYLFEPDEKCEAIKVEKVCSYKFNLNHNQSLFEKVAFLEHLETYRQQCCCASLCTCKKIGWGTNRKQPTLLDLRRDYTRSEFVQPWSHLSMLIDIWYSRSVQTQGTDSMGRWFGHLYDRGGYIKAKKSQHSFGGQRIGAGQIQFLCMETFR